MAEKFKLTIVTPDREFFNEEADMVEFNTTQGDTVRNAALHAGFVQILPQEITILAEIIEWPGEIDEARAEAARQRAEGRLADRSGIDVARAEAALMRSIARINAAKMK